MMLAIDPGNTESGYVVMEGGRIKRSGIVTNHEMLRLMVQHGRAFDDTNPRIAIEMIASFGMPVGAEVFETCLWIGRFVERASDCSVDAQLIYRRDVKLHLCGSPRAKDAHIRQALLDLIGPQGTKKAPGPTYGIKSHAWAALGVAATALNLQPVRLAA